MSTRVAHRYLVQEVEQALRELDQINQRLKANPESSNAGDVQDGIALVWQVLNLFDEALFEDEKMRRRLFITRNYWNGVGHKLFSSNQWFVDTAMALQGFPQVAEKLLTTLRQTATDAGPVTIAGMRVRNMVGHPQAIENMRPVIEEAASLVKARRWGAVLRSDVKIVGSEQMPPHLQGHVGAIYYSRTDDVYIQWPCPDDTSLVKRLCHEFGHRLWFQMLDSTYQREWEESWKAAKEAGERFVTRYAETDPKEDFAECFAFWVWHKPISDLHMGRLRAVRVAP